ncbi:MAG: cyclic nucleotide-binding domain-containing protein [Halocynthiibacter sp.]
MRTINLDEIKKLSLFTDIDSSTFENLMRGAYVQNFPPGVELITEGEDCDFFHILVEGTVELFAGWNTRETTMAVLRPISTFILAAAVRDAPCLMSARTLEKSRIIMIPSEDVMDAFDEDSTFAKALVVELAQCYRGVIKSTKNMKLRTSVERLANYILKEQAKENGAAEFHLKIEKRKLASLLGMTPENLSRAIKTLKPYGVEFQNTLIILTDEKALKTLAKPTYLIDDPTS